MQQATKRLITLALTGQLDSVVWKTKKTLRTDWKGQKIVVAILDLAELETGDN